jgi:hypothetical protein
MPIYEYTCKKCRLEKRFSVPAAHTGGSGSQLPVFGADDAPTCGPGYCRTGQCSFD